MKNMLRLPCILGLAAAALLTVSCRAKADYRNVLPADSFLTVSLNPASLLEKSGIEASGQCTFYDLIAPQIAQDESLNAEEKEYLLALLKNPAETGFDFNRDLYWFLSMGNDLDSPEMSGGLLLPIGDKTLLDRFMERLNQKSGIEPRREGGLTLAVVSDDIPMRALYAYNDEAFLLYFAQNRNLDLEAEAKALFKQQRKESLMGREPIADVLARSNDLNMVISYAGILSMANSPAMSMLPAKVLDGFAQMTVIASTNFEKGRIAMNSTMVYQSKQAEEEIAKFYAYVQPQTGALLPYLPATSYGVFSFGLNGTKLYALLAQLPGYGPMLDNPQIKQFMDALQGDCAIAFSGMTAGTQSYPVASLLTQVSDPSILQTLKANLQGMPMQQQSENDYSIELGGVTIRFGVQHDLFYITTDPMVSAALDGKSIDSMTDMKQLFEGECSTLYLDATGMKSLIAQYAAHSAETQMALDLLGLFRNLEIYGTLQEGTAVVNMTDTEQNALKSICDWCGALIQSCMTEE